MGPRVALVLCVSVFGAVVPLLEVNATHVFNPHWPGHARLHEVWQLATNTLLAMLCAGLAWRGSIRVAGAVALCVTTGFLFAYFARDAYGGSMLAVDGSEKVVGGVNVSALAVFVMAGVSVVLAGIVMLVGRTRQRTASINGIAHVQLSVSSMERSVPFYERLLHSLQMVTLVKSQQFFYCIGGRTGVAISPIDPQFKDQPYHQRRAGLHHLCFRTRSRQDVDAVHKVALELAAKVIRAPQEDDWAPGYYSVLFEDPDGIRIEANFVPGKGHLA